ncbi:transposase [Janthinobacterium sp.]|uniref:transposase n=1 Tax=Janthinobacterium sp. TaxID=1871054 RepID=UPI00344E3BD1
MHLLGTRALLQDWRGHLMVHDYAGYRAVFTAGHTEFACLAHMVGALVGKSSIYEVARSGFCLMLTE